MKILLVDDEQRFLATTQKLLTRMGIDSVTADSGEKALGILDEDDIDVVVLDVKMPGMDGIEVLKAIKSRHPLVEVIMLTGHATLESAVEGLKAGAENYLMKPCDIDTLLDKAREAFDKRRQRTEKALAGIIKEQSET